MTEALDIPESALQTKPWFSERPSPAIVREIKDYIKVHGTPHLWRGHTHTKPPKDGTVMYIGEFDLPAKFLKLKRFAPCPCCQSKHPKYGHQGKIAYFPDEKVIRIIGPECFKSLNKEEHERAQSVFNAEKKRARNLHYMKQQLHKVPQLLEVIEASIPIAQAVDDLQLELLLRLDKCLNTQMWDHVRDGGRLKVYVSQTVIRKKADGTEETFEEQRLYPFSQSLMGYEILERRPRSFAKHLKTAATKLAKVDFVQGEAWKAHLESMADEVLDAATKTFASGYKTARDYSDRLRRYQQFLSPMNLAVFKGWNNHEGCPIRIFIDLDGHELTVGRSANNRQRISVGPEYFHVLRTLPSVNQMSVNEMDEDEVIEQVA